MTFEGGCVRSSTLLLWAGDNPRAAAQSVTSHPKASVMPLRSGAPFRAQFSLAVVLALVVTMLAWTLGAVPSARAEELVANDHFGSGTEGWRTNSSTQTITPVSFPQGRAVRLSVSTTQNAVLNDTVNTVSDTGAPGQRYLVKTRVRTTTPSVNAALRFREVSPTGTIEHQTSFTLADEAWTMVYLNVTTTHANATMDLNLVAWSLRSSQDLLVDLVSVQSVEGTDLPAGTAPAPVNQCDGTVPNGTLFGSHISTSSLSAEDALAKIDSHFGRVPVVRVFDPGLPMDWSRPRTSVYDNRTMVISFRPLPQDVLSGKYDAYFRSWFADAPKDRVIYWSYIHEPEPLIRDGRFSASEYRAAWKRLSTIADEACQPNMFSTLILTGWTANPSSGRDYRTYDAGPSVIDVLAWDPYNGASDPDRDYYASISAFLAPVVKVSEADGRPWGIAETGSRLVPGDDGRGRAEWLRQVGKYLIDHNAQFVTYFQSTRDGDWRLNDPYSKKVWSDFVAGSQ